MKRCIFQMKPSNIILLMFSSLLIWFFCFYTKNSSGRSSGGKDLTTFWSLFPIMEAKADVNPTFVFVVCKAKEDKVGEGEDAKLITNPERQMEQLLVMIKSALFHSFIAFVDIDKIFDNILRETSNWPPHIRNKFTIEKRFVWFPEDKQHLRQNTRLCGMARFFLPTLLSEYDSVVYIDTDLIFMRPPEDMWDEFKKFDSVQISAIGPCLNGFGEPAKVPEYGPTGLNDGIWLMNLTRMRKYPGGWIKRTLEICDFYDKDLLVYYDQDVANILFNKTPQYLYELDCQWNYRMYLCSGIKNECSPARETGIYILHGNALTFYTNDDFKIKALYNSWKNFDVRRPLEELMEDIKVSFLEVTMKNLVSNCSKIPGIDEILIKKLTKTIYNIRSP